MFWRVEHCHVFWRVGPLNFESKTLSRVPESRTLSPITKLITKIDYPGKI